MYTHLKIWVHQWTAFTLLFILYITVYVVEDKNYNFIKLYQWTYVARTATTNAI